MDYRAEPSQNVQKAKCEGRSGHSPECEEADFHPKQLYLIRRVSDRSYPLSPRGFCCAKSLMSYLDSFPVDPRMSTSQPGMYEWARKGPWPALPA